MKQKASLISRLFPAEPPHENRRVEPSTFKQLERYAPLIELQEKRQLVQVKVLSNQHPHEYQSMVMGLDFYSETLYLDTLTPQNPYHPVQRGDTLAISHHSNGQLLSFSGTLKAITAEATPLYLLQLPTDIGYKTRRFYPRWQPHPGVGLQLRVLSPQRVPWSAKILNISAGGARIAVGGNVMQWLSRGSELPQCDIKLPSGASVQCRALLKTCKFSRRPYEQTVLGISFVGIQFQQRLLLQNFIAYQLSPGELQVTSSGSFS